MHTLPFIIYSHSRRLRYYSRRYAIIWRRSHDLSRITSLFNREVHDGCGLVWCDTVIPTKSEHYRNCCQQFRVVDATFPSQCQLHRVTVYYVH